MEQVFYVHKPSQRRMRNKLYKQSKKMAKQQKQNPVGMVFNIRSDCTMEHIVYVARPNVAFRMG